MSAIRASKRRKGVAHLGDWAGDVITWRVVVVGGIIVAREKGNPAREVSQDLSDWLAEKAGFSGATQPLKGVAE